MSIPILTFFNNKGGVGKTSLVYHLSWMFSELDVRVLAIDLDPQANLTAAFIDEEAIDRLWNKDSDPTTIYQAIRPLTEVGDLLDPKAYKINRRLNLIPGDVALADFEDTLSAEWSPSLGGNNLYRPFRILTAFWRVAQMAAQEANASLILADVGPNLGAINRSALIASDFVILPLGADLFSLQGLKNLGPTLRKWRVEWKKRIENWEIPGFELPKGEMLPLGYIVQQHGVRMDRPVKAYDRWINRIPSTYREYVLSKKPKDIHPVDDPLCLATVRHYRSLVPMAQEARKPIFLLTPADGAIGSHATAVKDAYKDFRKLARAILEKIENSQQKITCNG